MNRPTLVFDVDGVALDYQGGYRQFLQTHHAHTQKADKDNPLPLPKVAEWEFMNSEAIYDLKPLVDPQKFNQITQEARVLFVTNMPTKLKKKREENLRRLGFAFEALCMGGFETYGEESYLTKSQVILEWVGRWETFLFVDDYPENCNEVAIEFPRAQVLMLQGYYDFPIGLLRFEKSLHMARVIVENTKIFKPYPRETIIYMSGRPS